MKQFHHYLTAFLLRLIQWPKTCCVTVLATTAMLLFQMGQLNFDASLTNFLDKDNPHRQAYYDFKDQYGQSEYFILLIESSHIFTRAFEQRLNALTDEILLEVPFIESVESLANTPSVNSEGDLIEVGSLFDDLDSSPERTRHKALTNAWYAGRLINDSGDVTAVLIRMVPLIERDGKAKREPLNLDEAELALERLRQVIAEHQEMFEQPIVIGGSPMAMVELTQKSRRDILLFSLLATGLVALTLLFFFRRLSAMVLPLVSLILAVSITMSVMMICRYPIQVTGTILPSFLMAVCVGDAVHFLRAFYRRFDGGMGVYRAVEEAIRSTGLAMFFTTFTTSVGLLSFAHSEIAPIAGFGLFAALGVWVAFGLTLVFLPALLLLTPLRRRRLEEKPENNERLLAYVRFIRSNRLGIVFFSLILLGGCVYLSTHLKVSHDALAWLPEDDATRQAVEKVDDELSGTLQVELLINSKGAPLTAGELMAVDSWLTAIPSRLNTDVPIRSTQSIMDLLKQVNQSLDENAGLTLPFSDALLAQQLLLLQINAAADVERLCRNNCAEIRVTLTTGWHDAVLLTELLKAIEDDFDKTFNQALSLKITGLSNILNRTFTDMLSSMIISYLLAGILILVLMVLFAGNRLLGLAMMLPNLLPIFFVLALMYLFDKPLDLFSLLLGSIAIGLIVDDSVHLMAAFKRHWLQSGDVEQALVASIRHTGNALSITTFVLCAGFLSYLFSDLQNLANFGLLTSICIAVAFVADLLIAPAVILLLYGRAGENTVSAPASGR